MVVRDKWPVEGRFPYIQWVVALGAIVLFSSFGSSPAGAYIGQSFLEVPGIDGGLQDDSYKGWVPLEAHYWGDPPRIPPLFRDETRLRFSGPRAPKSGPGDLTVSLDKRSSAYAGIMTLCANKTLIPEMTYAESSDRARPAAELGRRPENIPSYFEYSLKNVTLTCPEVAGAPEQALILQFQDISWRNYDAGDQELSTPPAVLPPTDNSGRSIVYIINWLVGANSVSDDQCPVMSAPPSEEDYYALKSPEEAEAKRAEFEPKGGVLATFITGEVARRGPMGLNVSLLPGIVPDPGMPSPQVDIARGLDLDGDIGKEDFVSEDGELKGIDNELFRVVGCIKGFGPKGILTVTTTEERRNGQISMMLLISGIDDEQNDDHVDVTLFYSKDPMVKSADGKDILPGYTFRVSDNPERTPYFQRFSGRIAGRVVYTDPVDVIEVDGGRDNTQIFNGRMRLELNPDRTLKGVIAGYEDWRAVANRRGSITFFETGMGYSMPAFYNALKRNADGLPDPVTGEFNGISSAIDIEGVAAYIPPEEERMLLQSGIAYAN